MEIEFSGQPTKEIYFNAIRWVYKPSRKSMIIRIAAFVFFAALYIALAIVTFQEEGVSPYEASRLFRHLATFLFLGYILFQPVISAHRKATELWKDPSSKRSRTGRVSPLGVMIDPMKDVMRWETFVRMENNPDYLVLLTSSRMFVLLQRSFFRDEQEWKLLQNMAVQKVQEVNE